jgi:hypothetical protein
MVDGGRKRVESRWEVSIGCWGIELLHGWRIPSRDKFIDCSGIVVALVEHFWTDESVLRKFCFVVGYLNFVEI